MPPRFSTRKTGGAAAGVTLERTGLVLGRSSASFGQPEADVEEHHRF
jgi:hypothetical protein